MNQPRPDFHPKIAALNSTPGDRLMGRVLAKAGKLTVADTEGILKLQEKENIRFGDAARKLGLVTESDIEQALMQQFDYSCLASEQDGFGTELCTAYRPYSPGAETLRALRSQLVLRWFGQNRSSLAIVGTMPNTGCSYVAANLAVLFSQLGERTLLIDADLRTGRQNKIFQLHNRLGLADILAEKAGLEVIVQIPQFTKLSVLPAGTQAPNPQELLGRATLSRLLHDVAEYFDVILIDTHPCFANADALAVAAQAKGALIVVRKDQSSMDDTRTVVTQMTEAGTQVIGSALNEF